MQFERDRLKRLEEAAMVEKWSADGREEIKLYVQRADPPLSGVNCDLAQGTTRALWQMAFSLDEMEEGVPRAFRSAKVCKVRKLVIKFLDPRKRHPQDLEALDEGLSIESCPVLVHGSNIENDDVISGAGHLAHHLEGMFASFDATLEPAEQAQYEALESLVSDLYIASTLAICAGHGHEQAAAESKMRAVLAKLDDALSAKLGKERTRFFGGAEPNIVDSAIAPRIHMILMAMACLKHGAWGRLPALRFLRDYLFSTAHHPFWPALGEVAVEAHYNAIIDRFVAAGHEAPARTEAEQEQLEAGHHVTHWDGPTPQVQKNPLAAVVCGFPKQIPAVDPAVISLIGAAGGPRGGPELGAAEGGRGRGAQAAGGGGGAADGAAGAREWRAAACPQTVVHCQVSWPYYSGSSN